MISFLFLTELVRGPFCCELLMPETATGDFLELLTIVPPAIALTIQNPTINPNLDLGCFGGAIGSESSPLTGGRTAIFGSARPFVRINCSLAR